jgi:AmiR/NasT family two-component response regulator
VATISLLQDRAIQDARLLTGQLQTALNNRVIIEQAKGVLSEKAQVDMDAAFQLLRRHARNNNLPLPDVARALIEGGLTVSQLRLADR